MNLKGHVGAEFSFLNKRFQNFMKYYEFWSVGLYENASGYDIWLGQIFLQPIIERKTLVL